MGSEHKTIRELDAYRDGWHEGWSDCQKTHMQLLAKREMLEINPTMLIPIGQDKRRGKNK